MGSFIFRANSSTILYNSGASLFDTGLAPLIESAILSEKKYDAPFIIMAMISAIYMPLAPPKYRPTVIRMALRTPKSKIVLI
jgi:hypothetical protein